MIDLVYRDAAIAPLWAGTNALLVLAGWRLARRFFPGDDQDELVVHSIVACWAFLAGAAIVLGTVGALTGPALIAVVAVGAGMVLYRGRRWRGSFTARSGDGDEPSIAYRIARYLFCIFLVLHVISNGLGGFPEDWDTLMYHLPHIDQWLQSRSLFVSDCYNWSHPGNNELIGLWMVAPFSGDFLISLNNLPAAALLGFASVALGRSLGLTRGMAYLTAAAILSNAVVFRQLLDAKNDVAVAALLVACLNYGIRAARRPGIAEVVWGGLSIGLLAGAKFNGLGYAALALATTALVVGVVRGRKAVVKLIAVWSCCLIVWGGFWYIRNAIVAGSPLYPMGLTRESNVLTRIYPELRRSSFWGCGRPELLSLALDAVWRMAGPAHLAAVLAVPVLLIWLTTSSFLVRADRGANLEPWIRRALALWILGSVALLMVTPFSVEDTPDTLNHLREGYTPVRFGLCFLSAALLAFAVVLQDLSRGIERLFGSYGMKSPRVDATSAPIEPIPPRRRMARLMALAPLLLWAVTVAVQFVMQSRQYIDDLPLHLLVTIVVFEAAWILWLSCGTRARFKRWTVAALILSSLIGAAWSCGRLSSSWHRDYVQHYDSFLGTGVFSRLSTLEPRPRRICALFYRAHPFHGPRRDLRVFQPMWVPSVAWLRDYLKRNEINLLILPKQSPLYAGWRNFDAVTVQELVEDRGWAPIYEDTSFEVFRMLDRSPEPSRAAWRAEP